MAERILVYGLFADKLTGQDTFLLNMNAFMSSDCIFDYVVMGNACIHEADIRRKGGTIYYIENYWESPIGYIRDVIRIYRSARSSHRTAYFNLFSMVHDIPIIVGKMLGYKIVLHSHNSSIPRLHSLHFFNRFFINHFLKPDKRLACSEVAAQFMFGKNKSYTKIYNAIDTVRFQYHETSREKIRDGLNIDGKLVIGFVGRLESQKNPFYLVDIACVVHKTEENFIMLIIGDGEYKKGMQDRAKKCGVEDHFLFMGNVKNVEEYYCGMDVFVLPSLYEGLPLVLVEAQSTGLPCVISKEGVSYETVIIDEMIRQESIHDNIHGWADAILDFNRKDIARAKCHRKVEESRYNICTEAERLEGILTGIGRKK